MYIPERVKNNKNILYDFSKQKAKNKNKKINNREKRERREKGGKTKKNEKREWVRKRQITNKNLVGTRFIAPLFILRFIALGFLKNLDYL